MRQRIFRCLSFIIFLVIIENTLCCAILFFYVYFRILTKQQHAAKSTFLVKLGFFNFDYFNLSKKILVFKGFFASSWIKFHSYFCFFRSCFFYRCQMDHPKIPAGFYLSSSFRSYRSFCTSTALPLYASKSSSRAFASSNTLIRSREA